MDGRFLIRFECVPEPLEHLHNQRERRRLYIAHRVFASTLTERRGRDVIWMGRTATGDDDELGNSTTLSKLALGVMGANGLRKIRVGLMMSAAMCCLRLLPAVAALSRSLCLSICLSTRTYAHKHTHTHTQPPMIHVFRAALPPSHRHTREILAKAIVGN